MKTKGMAKWMLVFVACSVALSAVVMAGSYAKQEKDIVDTAVAAGDFKTLVAAVQAAGLVEVLKGEGPSRSLLRLTRLLRSCRRYSRVRCLRTQKPS